MNHLNNTKAILLAAGLGTRLHPITNNLPKCLVPINGKPLLGLWIEKLHKLGVTEILINTHYLSNLVENYIQSHPLKNIITLVHENSLLGTAGTLIKNQDFWKNDTCFIIHADNYCASDLSGFLNAHVNRSHGVHSTLLLFETNNPENCGVVRINKNNIVTEFHEKKKGNYGNLASGAIFIFSPDVYKQSFSGLSIGKFYEISVDIIPSMLNRIQGWIVDSYFIDIGTIENYRRALEYSTSPSDII